MFQIYHVQEGRTKHSRFFDEDLEDHQPFPTLQQALEVLDPTVGFNVEVKWTMQLKVQFILCKLNLKFYLTKLQTDLGDILLSNNFSFLLFGIQKLLFFQAFKTQYHEKFLQNMHYSFVGVTKQSNADGVRICQFKQLNYNFCFNTQYSIDICVMLY